MGKRPSILSRRRVTRIPLADNGSTPLHDAALFGHVDVLCVLVEELGADVSPRKNDQCTPLHLAASNGHTDAVRVLVRKLGADVGTADALRDTPLHDAARDGFTDIARILLEQGADVDAINNSLRTPFHLSKVNGHCTEVFSC